MLERGDLELQTRWASAFATLCNVVDDVRRRLDAVTASAGTVIEEYTAAGLIALPTDAELEQTPLGAVAIIDDYIPREADVAGAEGEILLPTPTSDSQRHYHSPPRSPEQQQPGPVYVGGGPATPAMAAGPIEPPSKAQIAMQLASSAGAATLSLLQMGGRLVQRVNLRELPGAVAAAVPGRGFVPSAISMQRSAQEAAVAAVQGLTPQQRHNYHSHNNRKTAKAVALSAYKRKCKCCVRVYMCLIYVYLAKLVI